MNYPQIQRLRQPHRVSITWEIVQHDPDNIGIGVGCHQIQRLSITWEFIQNNPDLLLRRLLCSADVFKKDVQKMSSKKIEVFDDNQFQSQCLST